MSIFGRRCKSIYLFFTDGNQLQAGFQVPLGPSVVVDLLGSVISVSGDSAKTAPG
jgi:hypothetical protein